MDYGNSSGNQRRYVSNNSEEPSTFSEKSNKCHSMSMLNSNSSHFLYSIKFMQWWPLENGWFSNDIQVKMYYILQGNKQSKKPLRIKIPGQ